MNVFGISNVNEKQLNFDYDKHYRKTGLLLNGAKTEDERKLIKENSIDKLNELLSDVCIDINILKRNFINILFDEKSSEYLWILYSKYENKENYIDKISDILKRENQVTRGGVNTYKMNGWMAHSLYVYQIVNKNIANNIEIANFNGNEENKKQVSELYEIYKDLSKEAKFILKVFALIHDIGVIDNITFHDKLGSKYVEKVLEEIGIDQMALNQVNSLIELKDFIKILQELIKYHTLITSLSSENSDLFVENEYKKLISEIPKNNCIEKEIPAILFTFAYGDVIAVDDSLMDREKYQRIKDGYEFFKAISNVEKPKRNKEKVVIERICDMVGKRNLSNLELNFGNILEKNNIEKKKFIENMYDIKSMKYTLSLMKNLKDIGMTIKIYYELFELIEVSEGKEELKNYTIIFIPNNNENEFVEQFKNGNFFECVRNMKVDKKDNFTYKSVNIEKGANTEGKYLYIRVV